MSGISNLLAPYSHLLFGNRDKVIVVLALVLGWTVVQLLVARWRTERLERDLSTARSGLSTSPARVRLTAASAQADEAPAESGALPPIKGGRSYARNLGSALQKAGIPAAAGPQLYSPPVPAGWNPNTGTAPGAPIQPPMPAPTYAPPPAPWGAPPTQAAPPWGYPAGANRPAYPAQPGTQTPPPYAPGAAPFPFPSPNQGQPAPNLYPPAPAYGQPSFPAMTNAAPMAEPTAPAPLAAAQPFNEAQPVTPGAGSDPTEESRRGKPKRRRFSLSVLDKIVQSKTGDPSPTIVPPVVPLPVTAEAVPVVATPTPVADPQSVAAQQSAADEQSTTAEAAPEEQLVVDDREPEPAVVAESPIERAEPAPAPEPESGRTLRSSMRAMLFGEEPVQAPPARETEAAAEVTEAAATTWPTDEVTAPDPHAESEPSDEAPVEAIIADTSAEAEAATPAEVIDDEHHDALAEAEPPAQAELMSEPAAVDAEQREQEQEQAPQAAEPPAASEATAPSAGTLVIIEDDQTAADYYATLFRGNGYHVDVANDGVSGVDLCTRVQPQVILLDVMMPRQNGILVLQTLRASDETRNTPVVVMSNFSEPTLIKRALQLGALEYVIKTQVAGPALLAALPHWLNREKAFAA